LSMILYRERPKIDSTDFNLFKAGKLLSSISTLHLILSIVLLLIFSFYSNLED